MGNILLPSKMSFSKGEKENESILVIEPLYHGYGTTVGNALRRVLLSSLEGAAVTAVKIKGAQHEFSTLPGVKEDVLEIILNFKKLRLKVFSEEPVVLNLNVTGREGEVTAADITPNADIQIVSPDLVLATLTAKDANFNAEITVGRGLGFDPTENRNNSANEIGMIAVDAMYSPVINVSINVEATRVGEITNYDKLVMNIMTDGTITPEDAVKNATETLLNQFNWIAGQLETSALTEKIIAAKEKDTEEEPEAAASEETSE